MSSAALRPTVTSAGRGRMFRPGTAASLLHADPCQRSTSFERRYSPWRSNMRRHDRRDQTRQRTACSDRVTHVGGRHRRRRGVDEHDRSAALGRLRSRRRPFYPPAPAAVPARRRAERPGRDTTAKWHRASSSACDFHDAMSRNASAPVMKQSRSASMPVARAARACRWCTRGRRLPSPRRRRSKPGLARDGERRHRETVRGRRLRARADAAARATERASTSSSPSACRAARATSRWPQWIGIERASEQSDHHGSRRCRRPGRSRRQIVSSSSGMPSPLTAEIGTTGIFFFRRYVVNFLSRPGSSSASILLAAASCGLSARRTVDSSWRRRRRTAPARAR